MVEGVFIRGDGDKYASPIMDELIATASMARVRAKRFFDDPDQGAYYQTHERQLLAPHKGPHVVPGAWITVTDGRLGLSGTAVKVTAVSIQISATAGVFATLSTQEFKEP